MEEGLDLVDQAASFGKPYPTIIFTGGDPLKRPDIFELLQHAGKVGIGFALSPAITDTLSGEILSRIKSLGTSSISVSLDGAFADTHDLIRGRARTFEKTVDVLRKAKEIGLQVQVNTAIMKRNFAELPKMFHLIRSLGVRTWELFFLVKVGRGNSVEDLSPEEAESVCNFLYDVSRYDCVVRCVEAPFIRRVAKQRAELGDYWGSNAIYSKLKEELAMLEGNPARDARSSLSLRGTLDGDGIIFVAYDGSIHPGGLVPLNLGNVRSGNLVDIYRNNELLRSIRERKLNGACGECGFRDSCGGSRARALAYFGDPRGSDPACINVSRFPR